MNDQPKTVEQTMADELDDLFIAKREAELRLCAAVVELDEAQAEAKRAELRYQRQALWIKADEQRRELAKTEAAAAAIRLED